MKFAAQIEFQKKGSIISYLDGEVVSGAYMLPNYMTSIEYDIFNPNILESDKIKSLPDGHYMSFVLGELQSEQLSDPDIDIAGKVGYIFLSDDEDIDVYELVVDRFEKKLYQKLIKPQEGEEDKPNVHHSGQE